MKVTVPVSPLSAFNCAQHSLCLYSANTYSDCSFQNIGILDSIRMDVDRMSDILRLIDERLSGEVAAIRSTGGFQIEETLKTGPFATCIDIM